jgi:hypothetical protein
MSTETLPVSSFYSTNLNPRVQTYSTLSTRIAHSLGYPHINIEAHQNQVYENIAIAIEMFTKFAGYTTEYLVFNSELYEPGLGISVDTMMSITPRLNKDSHKLDKDISNEYRIGTMLIGNHLNNFHVGPLSGRDAHEDNIKIPEGWDNLLDDYRRVVDVFSFEEGSTSGVNTLFTIEQTLAQQTYFSYAMGNYGFDLISWYVLKQWLDQRRKLLAQDKLFQFNERTQRLHIIPEPATTSSKFYGAVGCYVEKPIRDLVKEPWVYQYSLALTKIAIARIRGKYAGTNLFGGGAPNYSDLLNEGLSEKATLEASLYEGTPGFGDAAPPMFFVG